MLSSLFFILCFLCRYTHADSTALYNICGSNTSTYTPNSTFHSNLNLVLSTLSSHTNRTNTNTDWYANAAAGRVTPNIAYGHYLCRGDVTANACRDCVTTAVTEITTVCPDEKSAYIWYDDSMLRYSNQSFFSTMDESPRVLMWNTQNVTEPARFQRVLGETMNNLADLASNDVPNDQFVRGFATQEANFSSLQTLYGLAQCTPDLNGVDCNRCLRVGIAQFPDCCGGKQGGRVLIASCTVRYEVYPFYTILASPAPEPRRPVLPSPPPLPSSVTTGRDGNDGRLRRVITIITCITALVLVLLGFCICYWRRRQTSKEETKKMIQSQEAQLLVLAGHRLAYDQSNENSRVNSEDFPLIGLNIILVATQHFSEENKLGEGGFGPVYKGTLSNGKEIAVKRLSRSSGQGLQEFKNEVISIARLQHRNLVTLLGCCLEGNELVLVYDYMPNKSLDVFLFDSTRGGELDWEKRLVIINGIARGLLYLHEDSRLRIIHRDLKASNVLLDHEMNPKISDFGMAKIFVADQTEANTNRVVGTYGYMAPEYAMQGIFSIKSDVFSFGVLLLEIVSGRKNSHFYLYEEGHSLLTFAWRLWCKGEGLDLIDPLLIRCCVVTEVLKCIHIGLLCVQEDPADRPTMSNVVVMLASETLSLPRPSEPAFSVGRVVFPSTESQQSVKVCSVNEVTLSKVSPR